MELKNSDINIIQGMSYESQLLTSNINSPFSNTFSFNKTDLKLMNKINFDMPISVDLDKIDTEDSKNENKNHKKNKIYHHVDNGLKVKSNKNENILSSLSDTHNTYNYKNSKIEKLENFINKLNADENTRNVNNINNENQQYPSTQSMTTEKLIKNNNEVFIVEDGLINNKNKNNKLNKKSTDNEIKKDSNNLNLNYNNGFYDDIVIKDEIEIDNNNKEKNSPYEFNSNLNATITTKNDVKYFLDNLELIHKRNIYSIMNQGKNGEKEFNNCNNCSKMKEPISEYEFNVKEGKFYEPLNKYEDKFNLDKINPF
jgi:hypothetical protein